MLTAFLRVSVMIRHPRWLVLSCHSSGRLDGTPGCNRYRLFAYAARANPTLRAVIRWIAQPGASQPTEPATGAAVPAEKVEAACCASGSESLPAVRWRTSLAVRLCALLPICFPFSRRPDMVPLTYCK
jgi:hypothetical protein